MTAFPFFSWYAHYSRWHQDMELSEKTKLIEKLEQDVQHLRQEVNYQKDVIASLEQKSEYDRHRNFDHGLCCSLMPTSQRNNKSAQDQIIAVSTGF